MSLGDNGTSERIFGTLVSGSYFDVLGTRATLGRFFRPDEDEIPDSRPVVVLSHAFWQRRFNADPDVLQNPNLCRDLCSSKRGPTSLCDW